MCKFLTDKMLNLDCDEFDQKLRSQIEKLDKEMEDVQRDVFSVFKIVQNE